MNPPYLTWVAASVLAIWLTGCQTYQSASNHPTTGSERFDGEWIGRTTLNCLSPIKHGIRISIWSGKGSGIYTKETRYTRANGNFDITVDDAGKADVYIKKAYKRLTLTFDPESNLASGKLGSCEIDLLRQ